MIRRCLSGVAAMLLALAIVACADEAAAPEDGAVGDEQSPQPESFARAPTPELGEGIKEIGGKRITLAPSPGLLVTLTPYELELAAGEERPPCDRFVFAFGWQVIHPASPPADFNLEWTFEGADGPQEIGLGARGTANVGCGVIEILNDTGGDISVEIHYLVGAAP